MRVMGVIPSRSEIQADCLVGVNRRALRLGARLLLEQTFG